VGVTIAQALGFAWNIPVKFLSKDMFIGKFG
jgi:tRNA A37 threonylcarbamoyladenosine modification protein TsaB